jgi:hypothetical protein
MMVSNDEAVVSVQSYNSLASPQSVEDKIIRDAAKLTVSRGFRYFTILNVQDTSRAISITTPGQATTNGSVAVIGNTAYYDGSTTYTPPHRMYGIWAGGRVQIKMFPEASSMAAQSGVYDSTYVLAKR